MDERLTEVENLFHQARQRPDEERAVFLDEACRGEPALRAEVESLLAHGAEGARALLVPEQRGGLEDRGSPQEGPGSLIGPYKLLQPLGEGGFGVVYMAEQREPVRRRIALKVIKLGMDTKQVIGRFEAERQALALMDHPNIAKVLDAGATKTGRPYFVMELVRGVPITEYCDKAEMGTAERLRLFMLVCRAVQHAHQKGIVHRDIKPSNILVTLHDGEPVPKVIDFGIAKATNQELTEKTVFTQFHQFIGTPEYMSPEQAEMSGLDIDTRADVYSLGVLLYELLTGTTPVDAKRLRSAGYEEIQRIVCEEEPERPSTRLSTLGDDAAIVARKRQADPEHLAHSLRGDLDWILLKALEKDRSRRYETASAFAADIERHLSDEPVVASPPSRAYKLRKLVRRNRGAFGAAAAVLAVLLLGTLGTSAGFLRARHALKGEQAARLLAEANGNKAREEADRHAVIARFFESSLVASTPWRFDGSGPAQVVDLLDLASERLESGELADQPVTRAMLAQALGDAYMARDRWESALDHFRLAIDSLESPEASPLTYSRAARELDRIDAEPYFEFDVDLDVEQLRAEALDGLEPLIEERDGTVARELFEWAHEGFLRARNAQAANLLRRLLDVYPTLADPDVDVDPTVVRFNLACAEARLGNEDAAKRLYEEASGELRAILERGDARAADAFLELCEHPAIGLFLGTEPPLLEVIELALGLHEERNLGRAESLWNAATILSDIGAAEEGIKLMRESVEVARAFDENRLMLGSALVQLARLEWEAAATEEALEHCSEALPLLRPTGGRPYRSAIQLTVADLVERIVEDPGDPATEERMRTAIELATTAGLGVEQARGGSALYPWWVLCGDMARMHRVLAAIGDEAAHAERARKWTARLRHSLAPYLKPPRPVGYDIGCTALADALLHLEDATRDELELALSLASMADDAAGGLMASPVATRAEALFRLDDLAAAVRDGRRALELARTSSPVRGLADRVRRYEAALAER